jgi:hypothetical protein
MRSLERVASHDRATVLDEWQRLYADLAAQARIAARERARRSLVSKVGRKSAARKMRPTTARLKALVLDRVPDGEQRKRRRPARRREASASASPR